MFHGKPDGREGGVIKVHVEVEPEGYAYFDHLAKDALDNVTQDIVQDARRRCPVDTGELVATIWAEAIDELAFVHVGTDHWEATEYGSRAHVIRSTGPWPLRNHETGQVFGREVHHPGTPEQPFMRPALYRKRQVRA